MDSATAQTVITITHMLRSDPHPRYQLNSISSLISRVALAPSEVLGALCAAVLLRVPECEMAFIVVVPALSWYESADAVHAAGGGSIHQSGSPQ